MQIKARLIFLSSVTIPRLQYADENKSTKNKKRSDYSGIQNRMYNNNGWIIRTKNYLLTFSWQILRNKSHQGQTVWVRLTIRIIIFTSNCKITKVVWANDKYLSFRQKKNIRVEHCARTKMKRHDETRGARIRRTPENMRAPTLINNVAISTDRMVNL